MAASPLFSQRVLYPLLSGQPGCQWRRRRQPGGGAASTATATATASRAYVHRDFPRIPVKGGFLGGAAPGFLVAALPVGVRARE